MMMSPDNLNSFGHNILFPWSQIPISLPCYHQNILSPWTLNQTSPPYSALSASPLALVTLELGTPSADQNHANLANSSYKLGAFPRPSDTPYSDAVKSRKHKKPGQIPRSLNAFMVFAKKERKTLSEANPKVRQQLISKRLGQMWQNLSDEGKRIWQDKADKLKILHQQQFPDYHYQPRKKVKKSGKKTVVETVDEGRRAVPAEESPKRSPFSEGFDADWARRDLLKSIECLMG